nr:aminopeptidase m1 [Quercus suber]
MVETRHNSFASKRGLSSPPPPNPKRSKFKGQSRLLKPGLTACNFVGSVAIHLHIIANTTFIILNAADLVDTSLLSFDGFYFLLLHCFPLYDVVCLLGLQWHIWKGVLAARQFLKRKRERKLSRLAEKFGKRE